MPITLPGTAALIFLVSGAAGAITFTAYRVATKLGPELEPNDFLPALPPNPPIPRFMIEKPELLQELKRE